MDGRHVAHFNRGYLRAGFGSPDIAPFETAIAGVNAVAARSPGFVCTIDLDMSAVRDRFFAPDADTNRIAATLSIWKDAASLAEFALNSIHGRFLARRREWFESMAGPAYVVWPILPGHRPTLDEVKAAYLRLSQQGPGPEAFDFSWLGRST